ncbi:hypothetical protein [Fimbriiglobus ruber]|uniref:hypothetical protein n=1 Tax=Fimbriiglobus ruber TaxID=1908690 RepID=UPI000B4AE621|nr:hypothetical protein [Fimbriiglobus ruber]
MAAALPVQPSVDTTAPPATDVPTARPHFHREHDLLALGMIVQLGLFLYFVASIPKGFLTAVFLESGCIIALGALLYLGNAKKIGRLLMIIGSCPLIPILPFALPILLGR